MSGIQDGILLAYSADDVGLQLAWEVGIAWVQSLGMK